MREGKGVVLIVDDESSIRSLLKKKLTGEGYECREAASAGRALAELNEKVDLIILDIMLPGKSGVQLLPALRTACPDTPVIMATALADTDIAIHCMRLGAYDYLTKPFNLEEVVVTAAKALEKRRLELDNRHYQQRLELKVGRQSKKIREAFYNALTALAYALEAKDKYTSGHSERVAIISLAIASELGLRADTKYKIELAGRIHDIGKIGVRESVLNKPDQLSDEEYRHIKCHPEVGEHILMPVVEDKEVLKIVRHHHERYDGRGYPDGLLGERIPLGARILAVADSYDAMMSERPYRRAMSAKTAYREVEWGINTQFDPQIAAAFLKIRDSSVLSLDIVRSGLPC